jgi:hypothetical protein
MDPTTSAPVKTDHLDEDFIKLSGQNYALISVVSPSSTQKHDVCAMKIRGVFDTKEDAQHHVKRLMQSDSTFDVFLVDMYKWLPIPPDSSKIDDKVYQEEMLNEIIRGHQEEQLRVKEHFEERKKDSLLPPASASGSALDTIPEPSEP